MKQDTPQLEPGAKLGPWVVDSLLGTGAQAHVYVARDAVGRQVAIKVRPRGGDALDRRFLREFESLRLLRLKGVVPVYDAGIEDELLWFSMELVDGIPFFDAMWEQEDLAERVKMATRLGKQLFSTLAALHEAGFVHRDMKHHNVLVDAEGQVHVLDFGIGRYLAEVETLSRSGEVMGTLPYMAPEQLAGLPFAEKVDVWAAALMIYEGIDGLRERPLNPIGWIPRICLESLPPLASKYKEVPLGLSKVLERSLDVDAGSRISARKAAAALREVEAGRAKPEWPEPPFVPCGDWWAPLETVAQPEPSTGHTAVLQGPAGSGKGRIAEQLQRTALMEGVWPIHVKCRVHRVGSAIEQLLQVILADHADPDRIVGSNAASLLQLWPSLPIARAKEDESTSATGAIGAAVREVLEAVTKDTRLFVIVHDLEQADPLTARLIKALLGTPGLGLLLLHENRWATNRSKSLVNDLQSNDALLLQVPRLSSKAALELAQAVCPNAPPRAAQRISTAQAALELGYRCLARWRNEPFPQPDPSLWPVAVRSTPLPREVYRNLAGPQAEAGPWVQLRPRGMTWRGSTARAMARTRLANRRKSAMALAEAWEQVLGRDKRPADLAALWLLADNPQRAWKPAASAAIQAERFGRYMEARRMLVLLDALAEPHGITAAQRFHLAWLRAKVSLRTDRKARRTLVQACEALVTNDEQKMQVRLLEAEYDVQAGRVRQGLVDALRVAAPQSATPTPLKVDALLLVVRIRVTLGQIADAERDLSRAHALLKQRPDALRNMRAGSWDAEVLYRKGKILDARRKSQEMIRVGSGLGYLRGVAFASIRLAKILRLLGRRREAEYQGRSAYDAATATGDRGLAAEAGLVLATLLAERGDSLGSRRLLDDAGRQIRALRLDHLAPVSLRVALMVATLRADRMEAKVALDTLADLRRNDSETPAAIVRWWRGRDQDLAVAVPSEQARSSYGRLQWEIEVARATLDTNSPAKAIPIARSARDEAKERGFPELTLYANLVLGGANAVEDHEWSRYMRAADESMATEVFLGAVEMDARRLAHLGRTRDSRARWRTLRARAEELGYEPAILQARRWLGAEDT